MGRSGKLGKQCRALGCTIRRGRGEGKSRLITFPKDLERCKEWVRLSGNSDLLLVPLRILQTNRHLCCEHFETKAFLNRRRERLTYNAVPSIFKNPPLPDDFLEDWPNFLPDEATYKAEYPQGLKMEKHSNYTLPERPEGLEIESASVQKWKVVKDWKSIGTLRQGVTAQLCSCQFNNGEAEPEESNAAKSCSVEGNMNDDQALIYPEKCSEYTPVHKWPNHVKVVKQLESASKQKWPQGVKVQLCSCQVNNGVTELEECSAAKSSSVEGNMTGEQALKYPESLLCDLGVPHQTFPVQALSEVEQELEHNLPIINKAPATLSSISTKFPPKWGKKKFWPVREEERPENYVVKIIGDEHTYSTVSKTLSTFQKLKRYYLNQILAGEDVLLSPPSFLLDDSMHSSNNLNDIKTECDDGYVPVSLWDEEASSPPLTSPASPSSSPRSSPPCSPPHPSSPPCSPPPPSSPPRFPSPTLSSDATCDSLLSTPVANPAVSQEEMQSVAQLPEAYSHQDKLDTDIPMHILRPDHTYSRPDSSDEELEEEDWDVQQVVVYCGPAKR